MRHAGVVAGVLGCLVIGPSSFADTALATFTYEGTGQVSSTPAWTPYVSYGDPALPNPSAYMDGTTLTLLDVAQGNSYELTGDIAGFKTLASDDLDDPIYIGFTVPGGTGSGSTLTELSLLANAVGLAPAVGTPDFAGYELTRIRILGTAFQSGQSGAFTTTTEFTIYGDRVVPEPVTGVGLLALALTRRRR